MSLEQQVAALVTASNGLTQEVRDQLTDIQAAVAQAEMDVQTFIQQGAASFPVSPNLLADSKHFTGLCNGQLGTIMPWDQGGLGGAWGGVWFDGASGTIDVEVVYAGDQTRLTELGLWPTGELQQLVRHLPNNLGLLNYGVDANIAVFDITVTDPGHVGPDASNVQFVFQHDNERYTSWQIGAFRTQTSAFIAALSTVGDLQFRLITNRTWDAVNIEAAHVGQGFKHYSGSRQGFGGRNYSYVQSPSNSTGSIKIAVALPYTGFGDHQGIPIWAGSVGKWDTGDHL